MAGKGAKQGGKKKGRNQRSCAAYTSERRHEKSKVRRIRLHLRKHPTDVSAIAGLKKWAGTLFMRVETFHDLQHVRWS